MRNKIIKNIPKIIKGAKQAYQHKDEAIKVFGDAKQVYTRARALKNSLRFVPNKVTAAIGVGAVGAAYYKHKTRAITSQAPPQNQRKNKMERTLDTASKALKHVKSVLDNVEKADRFLRDRNMFQRQH